MTAEPQKVQAPSEPETPASSVDEELLEMMNTSNRFLNRRATTLSTAVANGGRETKYTAARKPLGPESEGMEAITGPTVEKRPAPYRVADPATEDDFARELVNQFSRPQTLMLKDTMPMPSGTMVMPPMPPLPGRDAGEMAPEVFNFDKDDAEAPEVAAVQDVAAAGGNNNSRPRTAGAAKPKTGLLHQQDTAAIPSLSTTEQRTRAYDALRADIAGSPDQLSEWIAYQMEHNHGEQLLKMDPITIKPELSTKKSKGKMAVGHLPSRSGDHHHHFDEISAHRGAEEKLSQMGREALKFGEKAGGKVGGWMKRVGKKV